MHNNKWRELLFELAYQATLIPSVQKIPLKRKLYFARDEFEHFQTNPSGRRKMPLGHISRNGGVGFIVSTVYIV